MKLFNIYDHSIPSLERHADARGLICDVFFNAKIDHVALIKSEPYAERGNHYHALSTQHMLITMGSLEYWYKGVDSDEPAKMQVVVPGDLITTPPFEVHFLRVLDQPNEFIVFTEGVRGGMDYESDTYRVSPITTLHD